MPWGAWCRVRLCVVQFHAELLQGLEGVDAGGVQDGDVDGASGEASGGIEATEATADDDDLEAGHAGPAGVWVSLRVCWPVWSWTALMTRGKWLNAWGVLPS